MRYCSLAHPHKFVPVVIYSQLIRSLSSCSMRCRTSFQQSPTGPPVAQQVTPQPSSCEDQQWYFDANKNACARETNYSADTLYASFEDCCSARSSLFDDGCTIFDGCNDSQPSKEPDTLAPITVSSSMMISCKFCIIELLLTIHLILKPLLFRRNQRSSQL